MVPMNRSLVFAWYPSSQHALVGTVFLFELKSNIYYFFGVCGLRFPWKPLHQKPEEGRKGSGYFLYFDRNNFLKNWTMVDYVELENTGTPLS